MKDIKELYENAKNGKSYDITKYEEAVKELMESNPLGYVNALEYIISSSIGLGTLNKFNERYGISVASYDIIMEALNNAITKCRQKAIDASVYNEHVEALEQYKLENYHCFNMYDEYKTRMPAGYLMEYYRYPKGAISNDSLNKIVSRYGEAAIPDLILKYNKEGNLNSLIKYLEKPTIFSSPSYNQWILECVMPLESSIKNSSIYKKSLSGIVESCSVRTNQLFNEAAIVGSNDEIEYTEAEVNAIKELILFKEYMVTCETSGNAMKVLQEVYSLYEEFGSVLEDVGDNIAPMLPRAEAGLLDNSKATGNAPGYLSKNHNLSYGEDENSLKKKRRSSSYDYLDDDDDDEYLYTNRNKPASKAPNTNLDIVDTDDLETYKRPSTNTNVPDADVEELKDEIKDAKTPVEKQQAINNYYYYTYKNSFNKTDSSTNVDDHSTNKRITNPRSTGIKNIEDKFRLNTESFTDMTSEESVIPVKFLLEYYHSQTSKPYTPKSVVSGRPVIIESYNNDEYYDEGLKDVLVKGADVVKKVAKKIAKYAISRLKRIRVPRTLLELSRMSTGKLKSIPGIPIVGTNIILTPKVITESTSSTSSSDVLLEFTDAEGESVILEFCKSKGITPIKITENSHVLAAELAGSGLGATLMTDGQVKHYKANGDITSEITMDGTIPAIVYEVNSALFQIIRDKPIDVLKRGLAHEYGHIKTWKQLSKDDLIEYSIKRMVIGMIAASLSESLSKYVDYFNIIYYSLKPERLANEAAGIKAEDIFEDLYGRKPPMDWKTSKLAGMVEYKIPKNILDLTAKQSSGAVLTKDEYMTAALATKAMYQSWFPDDLLATVMPAVDLYMEQIKKME